MRARPRLARLAIYSVLGLLVAAVAASPYFVMLMTALMPSDEVASIPPQAFPQHWQFSNFLTVFEAAPLADYIRSTLIVAVGSMFLVMAVAVPAAYYSARFRFRGRRAYLYTVLLTQLFAPALMVIGLYREFVALGLVDNYLALILTDAAFTQAFSVWMLRGFFGSIPRDLEEAAWIDGCSRMQALRRVTLPLALPGLVTAAIFTFIAGWNEFVVALTIISSENKKVLTVGLETFVGRQQVQWQYLFAGSIIAIVPVLILFSLIERHLVSGLTAGSVK